MQSPHSPDLPGRDMIESVIRVELWQNAGYGERLDVKRVVLRNLRVTRDFLKGQRKSPEPGFVGKPRQNRRGICIFDRF